MASNTQFKSRRCSIYVDTTDATEYLTGGFHYVNTVLQLEGYVLADGLVYVFNYKDHLGNVRFSYVGDIDTVYLDIIDEAEYYPFGLKHENYAYSADASMPISINLEERNCRMNLE